MADHEVTEASDVRSCGKGHRCGRDREAAVLIDGVVEEVGNIAAGKISEGCKPSTSVREVDVDRTEVGPIDHRTSGRVQLVHDEVVAVPVRVARLACCREGCIADDRCRAWTDADRVCGCPGQPERAATYSDDHPGDADSASDAKLVEHLGSLPPNCCVWYERSAASAVGHLAHLSCSTIRPATMTWRGRDFANGRLNRNR